MTTEDKLAQGTWTDLALGYDQVLARLPDALKAEGFGIITQVDMQETLKAKLGVSFRRYRILGACNPGLAHKALLQDPKVGVLLPCNVVVYENDNGNATVGAVDPMATLGAGAQPGALGELARDVAARLHRVLQGLSS